MVPSLPGGLIGRASARSLPMRPRPRVSISMTEIVASLRFQLSKSRPENSAITANTAPAIASAASISIKVKPARPGLRRPSMSLRLRPRPPAGLLVCGLVMLLRRLADLVGIEAVGPPARPFENDDQVIKRVRRLLRLLGLRLLRA